MTAAVPLAWRVSDEAFHSFLFLSNAILSVVYPVIVDIRAQAIRCEKYNLF